MSGGNVSYNLRPNKFVERQLFVELLTGLCTHIPNEELVYVSLGGPQLEDHRLIHQRLGLENLISLEADEIVLRRQQFNLRPSFVKCKQSSVSDFVVNFDDFYSEFADHKKIIWFDYASPKERLAQLTEYQTILNQLEEGDVLKITLNASPNTLGEQRGSESDLELQDFRRNKLLSQLGSLLPNDLDSSMVTKHKLPSALAMAIQKVSIDAMKGYKDFTAMPLAMFVYQDGPHQMLTVTVRITKSKEVSTIRSQLKTGGWKYLPPVSNWKAITRINVPNLSVKERLYLEQTLFTSTDEDIHANLPFQFHTKKEVSLQMLREYAQHYRRYPSYFQVII